MAGFDNQELELAGVYAEALYGLATESGQAESVLEELQELSRLLASDARLRDFLSSPLVEASDRAAAIEKVFRGRASDLVVDTLQVINRKGRSGILAVIAEAYRRAHDLATGRLDVDVSTAVPLTDPLRAGLVEAVRKVTGKTARLHETVEPELLSGMVVRFGDAKFDSSAASSLARLHGVLLERASREIIQGTLAGEG